MALTDQRQRELEKMSIQVYQLISAGYPAPTIRDQISSLDLDAEEADWLWDTGKQRYFGYQQYLRDMNRGFAKHFIICGITMVSLVFVIVSTMGWPTAGRHVGMANLGIIGGIGAMLYGAFCWVTASPTDVRTDLT